MKTPLPTVKWIIGLAIGLVLAVAYVRAEEVTTRLFLIGDSTMSSYGQKRYPRFGWGQVLESRFDGSVKVNNHARSGRSSKSFRNEGHWETVRNALRPGDFVVIQFGHNDSKSQDPKRFTQPWESYSEQLIRYVEETRARGAQPILVTSICRRRFDEEGNWQATLGDYPAAMRQVASDLVVPLVDLQAKSRNLLEELGPERSLLLFLHVVAGAFANYPQGVEDDTHLSEMGARKIAALFVEGLCEMDHDLVGKIRR